MRPPGFFWKKEGRKGEKEGREGAGAAVGREKMRSGAGGGPLKTAEGAGVSLRMYAGIRRGAGKMRTTGEGRTERFRL
jgi:hypothetical protein